MYFVEVKIKKSSIKDVCTSGKQWLVKGDYEVNGMNFASGTLVFCGFRGNKVKQDVWGGVYHFDGVGHIVPTESITPAQLDKALASNKATTNKKK